MKSSHAKQNLCTAAFLFIFNSITTSVSYTHLTLPTKLEV